MLNLLKILEIFTVLLWNLNNLELGKKDNNIFLFSLKFQLTIEIA